MERERPWLDGNLTLSNKTGIPRYRLSRAINTAYGSNFFTFVNGYRVRAVRDLLDRGGEGIDNLFRLALDCGFQSKSTFNDAFRKMTGQTPSVYRKEAR